MKNRLIENLYKEKIDLNILSKTVFDEMQDPLGFWSLETNYASLGSREDNSRIKEYELKNHPNAVYKKNNKGEFQYFYSMYENSKYYKIR
jgi:hypothetical protein